MFKEKITKNIWAILILSSFLLAQDSLNNSSNSVAPNVPTVKNNLGFVETTNRLPQLLKDVKILLTDAIIADAQGDTLEVIYNLDRIYELLSEADQLGEKTAEDKEEFDRFENALLNVVTQRLFTLEISGAPVAAAEARESLDGLMEPMEVEMGASKFIVVDDRDGHIPLVRNKAVDQFISYFQNKGRRQFEIWLDRYSQYGPMLK
jgi:membrane-bound lytic murein transglycosylase D